MVLLIIALLLILVTGSSFTLMKASWFLLVESFKANGTSSARESAVHWVL